MTRKEANTAPTGREFIWGQTVETYMVGPYAVVEYEARRPSNVDIEDWEPHHSFSIFVQPPEGEEWVAAPTWIYGGREVQTNHGDGWYDTGHGASSLERALVEVIAFRREWQHRGLTAALNSRAAGYFLRMIGPDPS